jgi:hypothetical protein
MMPTILLRARLAKIAIAVVAIALVVAYIRWAIAKPADLEAAEAMLDRDLIAYQVWDGTPVIVWTMGYETPDGRNLVFLDKLYLDPVPMDLPPRPRWQWTGMWNYVDGADDPATVGYMHEDYGRAIYGSITDPSIVAMEVSFDGAWMRFDVAAPGFLVRLDDEQPNPAGYRWLDAAGTVVYEKTDDRSGP